MPKVLHRRSLEAQRVAGLAAHPGDAGVEAVNTYEFIRHLAGRGRDPLRQGDRWIARCPAHDDEKPSLSVASGQDQRVLVKCHAGCTPDQIVTALGLRLEDLFALPRANEPSLVVPITSSSFEIRDTDGRVVAIHHRRDEPGKGKVMWWSLPGGKRGLDGLRVAALPLFGVEHLGHLADGSQVIVVEGEKAALALLKLGIPSAGTVTGAAVTPAEAPLAPLLRLRPILWADADPPGQKHMERLGASLLQLGATPRIVTWPEAPDGGDAADFIARGGTADGVRALIAAACPLAVPDPAGSRQPVLVCVADVQPETIHWLWQPFIPSGKLTILEGDPGLGKSFVALAVITAMTRGARLPGVVDRHALKPERAVYLTAEDGIADTIRPRLDAMGAAVELVDVLEGRRGDKGEVVPITLQDIDVLEAALQRTEAKLVVIDPVQGFLGADVDMHRANQVRPLLAALGRLAAKFKCAVLLIRHVRKSGADRPVHAGLGSIDFSAAARSILLVGQSPEDEGLRILAHAKSSLAKSGGSQSFRINEGRFVWTGPSSVSADELSAPPTRTQKASMDEASEFLEDVLAGGPVSATDVLTQATGAKITKRTLHRAKGQLGVQSSRVGGAGGDGRWEWSLPSASNGPPTEAQPKDANEPKDANRPLGNLGNLSAEGDGELG